MPQEQSKPSKQATDKVNLYLLQMSACEANEIEVMETGEILVSHANTPQSDLNLKEFIAELEQSGIAVEAQNFYCG